jgi:hypothetical protein
MKATKTFIIGESCQGGIITAEVDGVTLTIIGKEYDHTKKKNQQGNAKEWCRYEFDTTEVNAQLGTFMQLTELTTSYYADQILEWAKTKGVNFEPRYNPF